MRRIFELTIILGLGAYILRLFWVEDIDKYVNDRYVIFTVVAAAFSVGVVLLVLLSDLFKKKRIDFKLETDALINMVLIGLTTVLAVVGLYVLALGGLLYLLWRNRAAKINLNNMILVAVIAVGLFIPARTLSSSIAENRVDTGSGYVTDLSRASEPIAFDTSSYDLETWVNSISLRPNTEEFEGKAVKDVEGFIFTTDDLPEDTLLVSKFVLRCCAVDAVPVGIIVQKENWRDEFSEDDWVSVSGVMQVLEIQGKDQIVVTDSEIVSIDEPDDPYISQ